MNPLDLNLKRLQPDLSPKNMDGAKIVEKLVKDWTQPQQLEKKVSVGWMPQVLNLISQRSLSSLPKQRMIDVNPDELRKEMKELYLQSRISKTSETFSRPHRREALWMPVHAILCRDRFVFTCNGGTQSEYVLEDVMFHHVESICHADVLQDGEVWKVRPTANPSRFELWGIRNLVYGLVSNRVQDQDTSEFVVEPPVHCATTEDGQASSPAADSGGRFLRLHLSCQSEHAPKRFRQPVARANPSRPPAPPRIAPREQRRPAPAPAPHLSTSSPALHLSTSAHGWRSRNFTAHSALGDGDCPVRARVF
jgi:hypothetical protein